MTKVKVGDIFVDVAFDILDVQIIQLKTPVKTGQLRDGFKLDLSGNILNNVDYADKVEFGTIDRPGAFMVHRSIPEMQGRLAKRLAERIDTPGLVILPTVHIKVGG